MATARRVVEEASTNTRGGQTIAAWVGPRGVCAAVAFGYHRFAPATAAASPLRRSSAQTPASEALAIRAAISRRFGGRAGGGAERAVRESL
jgi:hypothetical protein